MAFPKATFETFRENWPEEVTALAIPAETLSLSLEDVAAIGWQTPAFRDATGLSTPRPLSADFREAAAEVLKDMPKGVFPRIGLCSWKASTAVALPIRQEKELAAILNQPDARIANGLIEAVMTGQPLPLHLIEWRDVDRGVELRTFVRGGRYAGASQYHLHKRTAWLKNDFELIEDALKRFMLRLCGALPMETVVADVLVTPEVDSFVVELIELNPATRQTDPGLFDWDRADFDGSLRLA